MGISSTTSVSRRGYLSIDELEQFTDITVTDDSEAADRISLAEELIDSYVGYQPQFMPGEVKGRCGTAGGSNYIYLDSDQMSVYQKDYFVMCEVEIIGGTGAGQRRRISASEYASGKLTVADNWSTNPDTTSFYRVYQLGRFPRMQDVHYYTDSTPEQYYKSIPECVKRAVAAQVEFMIKMGDSYFQTDKSQKTGESILSYSYTKDSAGEVNLIAPKAKMLLAEVLNRTGEIA